MNTIIPVILAGGLGTRLWPLSRKSYPKQFSKLIGKFSLFQETALRLSNSNLINFNKQIILTNSEYRFIVAEQLQNISIDPGPILIEPESKNTAPAILAAAMYAHSYEKNAILLVAPSDHSIHDVEAFHSSLLLGLKEAMQGKIVTFGVPPTCPETGYGYLKLENSITTQTSRVEKFIEKPDKETAKTMISQSNYLWNAGIFMFRANDLIRAFKDVASSFIPNVKESIKRGKKDLGFFRLDNSCWSKCENLSIDYAVMEQLSNLVAVPLHAGWSDLGDWSAIWKKLIPNKNGNVFSSNADGIDCKNTLLRSENAGQEIIGLGLENIIAISMKDAVLVAHKSKTQDVSEVVSKLKSKNVNQAELFPKDHRPWGWFEVLETQKNFQVKCIYVKPGEAISLQSHKHRSEHWIFVEGSAKVTIDDEIKIFKKGESVFIPVGSIHRLENPGKTPTLIIEVQTGNYLGEDDIVRYEDLYSRA